MKNKTSLWRPFSGRRHASKHSCGRGFYGQIIQSHGIIFCGTCGHEFSG